MRLLRHPIDAVSVAIVVVGVGFQAAAYVLAWPWYAFFPLVLLMRWVHLVQHNHAHVPTFRQAWLNEVLGWLMYMNDALPLEFYRVQHVRIHHKYLNAEGDWTSPFSFHGAEYPVKPVGWLYYVLIYAPLSYAMCLVEIMRRPGTRAFRDFWISFLVFAPLMTFMLVHDPRSFLLFYGLVWVVGWIGMASNNWDHHVDCEYRDPYTSANVDLRFFWRWAGLNIGYHSAHHLKPSLHWSLLPELHRTELESHIPLEYYKPAGSRRVRERQLSRGCSQAAA